MIHPLDNNPNKAIGIKLPYGAGDKSLFASSYTIEEQAKSNLQTLLSTYPGERYLQPTFGCRLRAFLFEPITRELKENIQNAIGEAIGQWLPYIVLKNIVVKFGSEMDLPETQHNQIFIGIDFSVTSTGALQSITLGIGPDQIIAL